MVRRPLFHYLPLMTALATAFGPTVAGEQTLAQKAAASCVSAVEGNGTTGENLLTQLMNRTRDGDIQIMVSDQKGHTPVAVCVTDPTGKLPKITSLKR